MKKIYFLLGSLCMFFAISNQYADMKTGLLDAHPVVVGKIDSLFVKEEIIGNVSNKKHWAKFVGQERVYLVYDFSKDLSKTEFVKGESAILMKCILSGVQGVEKENRMFSSHQAAKEYYSLRKKNEDARNSFLLAVLGVIFLGAACFKEYSQFRKNRKNC